MGDAARPLRRRLGKKLDAAFPYWSLLPAILLFLGLSVYPILRLLHMSLSTISFEGGVERVAFAPMANVALLLNDPVLRPAIVNTLVFVAVSVAAEMIIGLALAIFVSRVRRGKGPMRTVMILPILVPPVAIGSMWRLIYNYDFGVINQAIGVLGIERVDWLGQPSLALVSVIIVDVWHWVPFIFLILFAAVEALPVDVIEAAHLDGASRGQITRHVILPLLMPATAVAFVFRAVLAFKTFDEVFLLTAGGPGTATDLISLHIYNVFFVQNQLGYGAMLSISLILMIVSLLLVGRRAALRVQVRHG
ncbi:MAG: sugar ABC transporter permease [Proteobacteria bacterium]|nr:sugar ABC transporter permease [Pseudomonadota bacterium]MBI3496606.1 sugar ABC transporter permease [Pseudomonadota bacterium]